MNFIDWVVIVGCNVLLIGTGLLIFSGKLDDVLTASWKKNAPHRRLFSMEKYHRWALSLCVVTAFLLDLSIALFLL